VLQAPACGWRLLCCRCCCCCCCCCCCGEHAGGFRGGASPSHQGLLWLPAQHLARHPPVPHSSGGAPRPCTPPTQACSPPPSPLPAAPCPQILQYAAEACFASGTTLANPLACTDYLLRAALAASPGALQQEQLLPAYSAHLRQLIQKGGRPPPPSAAAPAAPAAPLATKTSPVGAPPCAARAACSPAARPLARRSTAPLLAPPLGGGRRRVALGGAGGRRCCCPAAGVGHQEHYSFPLLGLKVVVDAGNGSGGFFATQVRAAPGRAGGRPLPILPALARPPRLPGCCGRSRRRTRQTRRTGPGCQG
jgi:hypothetical protein